MVATETPAGWICNCAEGYAEDGDGGCHLVNCAADPSQPTCQDGGGGGGGGGSGGSGGGGGGLSCTEIKDLYCPSNWDHAVVWGGVVIGSGACAATGGWACAVLAPLVPTVIDLAEKENKCQEKLEEYHCPSQLVAYDQTKAAVISGTLARFANEEDFPRSGLAADLSLQLSQTGPPSPDLASILINRGLGNLPEIGVPNPFKTGKISSLNRARLERIAQKGIQYLNQLSAQYHNSEISRVEFLQLMQQTNDSMDQEMEALLGKKGKLQFCQMMEAYSLRFLELYGIRLSR
jgi:hypothetical protein